MKTSKFSTQKLPEEHPHYNPDKPWQVAETNSDKYPENPKHQAFFYFESRSKCREWIKTVKDNPEAAPAPFPEYDTSAEESPVEQAPLIETPSMKDSHEGEMERLKSKEIVLAPKENFVKTGDIEKTTDKSCVAIVYPSNPFFELNDTEISKLENDYSHLKQLDIDDDKGYGELLEAIKTVKDKRLSVNHDEDNWKTPLNAFRKKIIEKANNLRNKISVIEDGLKAEKKRIDDIREEREAQQRMLWAKNLQKVQAFGILENPTIETLRARLQEIDAFNLESLDFGELIEDAKSALANAHIQINQLLAVEEREKKLREEQERREAEFKRQQEEQAQKDKENADALAQMQKQMQELQRQLDAEKAKNRPKQEETKVEQPPVEDVTPFDEVPLSEEPDEIQSVEEADKRSFKKDIKRYDEPTDLNVTTTRSSGRQFHTSEAERREQQGSVEETSDVDEGANDIKVIPESDIEAIGKMATKLAKFIQDANDYEWQDEDVFNGITRVTQNTQKMVDYLNNMKTEAEKTK